MNSQPTSWKIQQINQLRTEARRWRIATSVISFGITGVCIALLYTSATKLTRPGEQREEFLTEYKTGLTTQVVPQAQQLANRTWQQLVPAVRSEVVKMQGRYPELADGVQHELERLSVNLPVRAEKALRGTVGEMLAQRTETIQKLYGDIKPEQVERMRTVLQAEAERRAGSITEVLVQPFEGPVTKIHADLAAIAASTPDDKSLAQSSEQLTTLLVKLTGERLTSASEQIHSATQEPKKFAEVK